MEFPIFQIPYLGNGMAIAIDAVLHVIISHGLAIGAFTLVVAGEYFGLKKGSDDWENFSKNFLTFILVITTSVGAITGVGIWFITSVLSPRGIGSLLRIFFWPWFIEWLVFTAEVILILIYYFTWNKWKGAKKKRHIYLGVSYIFASLFSAFLITGILGFMLTSDGWPWDNSFWSAFFNPSFVPQLLLRISTAFSLGVIFSATFLVFTSSSASFRREGLYFFGKVAVLSLSLAALSSLWYFSVVPSTFKTHTLYSVLTSHFSQQPEIFLIINSIGVIILFLFTLFSLKGSLTVVKLLIIPAILISLGFVTEFERIREFIRGPYLMPGYMYANQILLKENPFLDKEGLLKHAYWYNIATPEPDMVNQGLYLFAQNCSACHTIGGINDIKKRVKGRTEDGIFVIISHTQEMVPFMPSFSGTEKERRIMAKFLYQLSEEKIMLVHPSRFISLTGGEKDE
jgi:mono/diheme cytochrome c family protein